MKNITKIAMVLSLSLGVCTFLNGRDRYVAVYGSNYNSGAMDSPWRTIQYAANRAAGGDTVHVLPGTYEESVFFSNNSGTASAPITFISDSRHQAKIRGTGRYPVFQIRKGDYVQLVGFDVSGSGTIGIEVYTSYNKIVGNHVHDIPGNCPTLGGAGINIAMASSHDNLVDANIVDHIGNDSGPCLLLHGIYTSNARTIITNNLVYATQGWGIHMWHTATQGTISNNTVFNNDAGGILVGAVSGEFSGGSGTNDYTVVSNNIVAFNGTVSRRFGISENGATGPHNVYANNLVWRNLPGEGSILTGKAFGNIWGDPSFANYRPDGSGDYRLRIGSPAINSGIGTTTSAPTNHDLEGAARPYGTRCDIGAFEFH